MEIADERDKYKAKVEAYEKQLDLDHVDENFISKDKIRAKIKEYAGLKILDKSAYEQQVKPLKELLEE